MKLTRSFYVVALGLCLAGAAHAAHDHHHGHEAEAPQKLQLNAGKKWATDASLRQAMSAINEAMGKALPVIHRQQFSDAQYQVLAGSIEQQIAFAIENCKLDAKADAMLHLIIADLQGGAEVMSGKTGGDRHDGAVRVLRALKAYGQYFQHPGWRVAQG